MSAQALDGSGLAKEIKAGIKAQVAALAAQRGVTPTLAVVRIGDDEAAAGYGRAIEKNCKSVGAGFQAHVLAATATQAEAEAAIRPRHHDPGAGTRAHQPRYTH